MEDIKKGIEILKSLDPGYYKCLREIERNNYSAPKTNILDIFIFEKYAYSDGSGFTYNTIGSDYPNNEEDLLKDCYREFSPLFNIELINKPVEATKEQPLYDNLEEWFKDQIEVLADNYDYYYNYFKPLVRIISNDKVTMQFSGFELILLSNGTYILSDTSGG